MKQVANQCQAIYTRKLSNLPLESPVSIDVQCTFIKGHPGEKHSWETLKLQDEADREVAEERQRLLRGIGGIGHDDSTPSDVQALLDNIVSGGADPYLEAILAVTHNRKRALRGVRGFGSL